MTKKAIGTYLDEDVYDRLVDRSEDTGIPMTRIIEDALRAYLGMDKKGVDKKSTRRKKNVDV